MNNREITPEMAKAELSRRQAAKDELSRRQSVKQSNFDVFKKGTHLESSPLSNLQDILSGMSKGGENIAKLAFGSNAAPAANIASENPNPLLQSLGQYLPAIASGGTSLPGQALASGVWGASQAEPNQQNIIAPKGRLGAGLETGLMTLGGGKALESISKLFGLSNKAIAENVLNAEKINKELYKNKYDQLWQKANQKGYGDMSISKPHIDIETLKKYTPKKAIVGIEEFLENPTLDKAHFAKSDLLSLQRELNNKKTLRTAERNQLKAVNEAIESIQNNMFKGKKGIIDPELKSEYMDIQKGYEPDVLSYTKNKAIQEYKRIERSADELVKSISKGKFMAKRGEFHPEINRSKNVKNLLKALGYGGGALAGGKTLYDYGAKNNIMNQ